MLDLKSQFIAWLDTKPADEEYKFMSTRSGECGCAMTQFLDTFGQAPGDKLWLELHYKYDSALRSRPHTFGALRDRLAKVS